MRRRGAILVAVLVIIALGVMAAVALMYRAQAEVTAAATGARRHQAYATALSGLQRATAVLQGFRASRDIWYDNPELFQAQVVAFDGVTTWYYTIYAHNPAEPEKLRYGLTDEASRINLNAASAATLLALPNMTEELVDCLMDYRDRDDEARPQGAEQEYYNQLPHPYLIKNGPLATVEELLIVKGFDAALVYGEDHNLNGLLEASEDDGDKTFPPDNSDGMLNVGLVGLATVWSYELNVDNSGRPRMNLNAAGGAARGLSRQTTEYIQLYRGEGNTFRSPAELLEARYQLKNAHGTRKAGEWIESGVTARDLPTVMDRLTTQGTLLYGLVNVNAAPADVLTALPGFDRELAERLVGMREDIDPVEKETIAWLYTQSAVPADKFKEIAPALTARSYQFRLRCVAYGWPCGQYRTIEAIIDLARGNPRILYQRDLTRLGMPMPIQGDTEERARS